MTTSTNPQALSFALNSLMNQADESPTSMVQVGPFWVGLAAVPSRGWKWGKRAEWRVVRMAAASAQVADLRRKGSVPSSVGRTSTLGATPSAAPPRVRGVLP